MARTAIAISIALMCLAAGPLGAADGEVSPLAIALPLDGACFWPDSRVVFAVNVQDEAGSAHPGPAIEKVEYLADEVGTIGESTESPAFPFAWHNPPVGSYTVTAKATCRGDLAVVSDPVHIRVTGYFCYPAGTQFVVTSPYEDPSERDGTRREPAREPASRGRGWLESLTNLPELAVGFPHPNVYPNKMPDLGYVRVLYQVFSTTGQCPPGATLTLPFGGEDVTHLGVNNLRVFRYYPARKAWSPLPSTVDKINQTVTAPIDKLGLYAISAIDVGDQEPPAIRWVLPPEGAVIKGKAQLAVVPTDNVGPDYLTFYLLRHDICASVPTTGDWDYSGIVYRLFYRSHTELGGDWSGMDGAWAIEHDFSHLVSGTYTLKVEAADRAGNVGTATHEIIVESNEIAPRLTIDTRTYDPAANTVRVTGTISNLEKETDLEPWEEWDNTTLPAVLGVEVDGELVLDDDGGEMEGGTWNVILEGRRFGPGEHTVTAVAVDPFGNTSCASTKFSLPLSAIVLVPVRDLPHIVNDEIQFQALTTGGSVVEYKFLVSDGRQWSTVREYKPENACMWSATKRGEYVVKVLARERSQTKEFSATLPQQILPALSGVKLTVTPSKRARVNKYVRLTATPVGGAYPVYRWQVHDGKTWTVLDDWYRDHLYVWRPARPGSYVLRVCAREPGSVAEFCDKVSFVVTAK